MDTTEPIPLTTVATAADAPAAPAPAAALREMPPARAALRSAHQALVVVERRFARAGDLKGEDMPPGWKWVLANTRVGDLYDRLFAEAQITWSSLIVPAEQQATFAALGAPLASSRPVQSYNGQLQLAPEALAFRPEQGEPLFLIFNGHRLPLCDLSHAVTVHGQNRCDVTLIDFPRARRRGYDENLRIDSTGQVQRVDRSYDATAADGAGDREFERAWPAIMVISPEAMRQLLDVPLPQRINGWPAAMLRAGLRLRGSTIPGRSFSLHDREHLYELNEVLLRLQPQWIAESGRLADQGQRIWVGRNVRIASTAQLIGPVAIGDDVEIGSDTVVVGPTTIGRGSRIGAGLVLKRCVVMPETILAGSRAPKSLSHAIVLGADGPSIQSIRAATEADVRAVAVDRQIRLETVVEAGSLPALGGFGYRAFCFSKRLVDILGSLVFLACTLPFYPVIALAIKINSPGCVFYAHVRQGRAGRNFKCWKFRTMVPDADEIKRKLMARNEVDGPQFKIRDDPRIFWVGRWLRKLNIDEWPQFFNVLIGQMSLVGPRPSPEKENQMCPAWREARLSVRPGITGLWQVCRRRDRGDTDFQEWIYYDVQYVKKQSIWMDTWIMFKTIRVIFGGGQ